MLGISASPRAKAYLGPFLIFTALLLLGELVGHIGDASSEWYFTDPIYWVYPLQTVICFILLLVVWRTIDFRWGQGWWFGLLIGVVAFFVWVAPQQFFGAERRLGGFDLWFFGGGTAFKLNAAFRAMRLIIVVPLVEELFWRGFLLRHHPFDGIDLRTRDWRAMGIVALLFGLAHWGNGAWPPGPDFVPAIITGVLYNLVAWNTGSVGACVIAHAVTNGLLGYYIFATNQWGFW